MFGAAKEQEMPRVYTPREFSKILRNFTRNGVLPPEEIIESHIRDEDVKFKNWEEIREISAVNRARRRQIRLARQASTLQQPVHESLKPIKVLRRAFATTGVVFAAGLHR